MANARKTGTTARDLQALRALLHASFALFLDLLPLRFLIVGEVSGDLVFMRGAELHHVRTQRIDFRTQRVLLGSVIGLTRLAKLGHRLLKRLEESRVVFPELFVEVIDLLLLRVRETELLAIAFGKSLIALGAAFLCNGCRRENKACGGKNR